VWKGWGGNGLRRRFRPGRTHRRSNQLTPRPQSGQHGTTGSESACAWTADAQTLFVPDRHQVHDRGEALVPRPRGDDLPIRSARRPRLRRLNPKEKKAKNPAPRGRAEGRLSEKSLRADVFGVSTRSGRSSRNRRATSMSCSNGISSHRAAPSPRSVSSFRGRRSTKVFATAHCAPDDACPKRAAMRCASVFEVEGAFVRACVARSCWGRACRGLLRSESWRRIFFGNCRMSGDQRFGGGRTARHVDIVRGGGGGGGGGSQRQTIRSQHAPPRTNSGSSRRRLPIEPIEITPVGFGIWSVDAASAPGPSC